MASHPGEVIPAPDADLCLNFANTRYWRGTASPTEDLRSLEDLLRWAETTERMPPGLVRQFDRMVSVFEPAIGLRETIHRCFAATAADHAPNDADLSALNVALAEAPARQRVRSGSWDVGTPQPSAALLLAPVLWSAGDLLVGQQLTRVRRCANPECGWLFLDISKSGNRRWCSMSACGNRAKVHRHYQRRKAQ